MLTSSLTGFAWGIGFACICCVIGTSITSVRHIADDV